MPQHKSRGKRKPEKKFSKADNCHLPQLRYPSAVADAYTWREMRRDGPSRLPGPDHLGWWVAVALLLAILLHVMAFFALGRIKFALGFQEASEMRTTPINVDQVTVLPPAMDQIKPGPEPIPMPDTASLLEEIDVLAQLPEMDLDITPAIIDPEFAIKPQQPLAEGAPEAIDLDPSAGFNLDEELPEMGQTHDSLPMAAEGQVIVDPGEVVADDPALDKFTDEILKKGAGGTASEGNLDGMVTLDDLVGLPENVLVGKKTMLPSDLLFEYDSSELRESARVGLMKLALLVERNPGLFCWIEGHTDLFGGNRYNLDLSRQRAKSVKAYLSESLRLDPEKIITRGYGKTRVIVPVGTVDEQGMNRRVEIKMRRSPPPDDEPVFSEPDEPLVPIPGSETSPDAIPPKVVMPDRELPLTPVAPKPPAPPKAIPVEEVPPKAKPVEEVPRALPVEPAPPKARPVNEEPPPKAKPVEEAPPKARPVGAEG